MSIVIAFIKINIISTLTQLFSLVFFQCHINRNKLNSVKIILCVCVLYIYIHFNSTNILKNVEIVQSNFLILVLLGIFVYKYIFVLNIFL